MQRRRSTAPCMECSESQVVTVTTWLFPFVLSCFVLGKTFFWPFLLVRVARTAVARCAGGRVSCWHYRFIEDTFHSAPDHGLDGRPSVLEGKTIWCLASTDTDTTNRHNTWTAERSKTNTWTEHLFIFLSLGSKVTPNHRISGFSSICKWSRQILLYNRGFQIWRKKWSPKGAQQCR